MGNIKIIYKNKLNPIEHNFIESGLYKQALKIRDIGKNNASFAFVVNDDNADIIAAIEGFNYYGCFYIDLFYVKEAARKRGIGSNLLNECEKLAKKRRCSFITVNTMDFEAKPFYEKHGFKVFYVMEGYENNSKMYMMRKNLA